MTTPTLGTHWEGCEQEHHECALAKLAAREAELAKMRDEREGNTRQFRRLQDRLAQAEVDAKFWMEVSAEQRAELLKIAENPYEGNESALDYSCTHWKQRAEAAERDAQRYLADAKRYWWLRDSGDSTWPPLSKRDPLTAISSAEEIDCAINSAIDAAIAAKGEA